MVCNSLKYVSWEDYKAVSGGRKTVYQAPIEEVALMVLDNFAVAWDDKYPISKSWRAHWENLNTLFNYLPDIRKALYTTNAIESLNSVIRAAIKKRKVFPTDDSVRKGHLPGGQVCIKKMEYADPELVVGNEPFYYRVR